MSHRRSLLETLIQYDRSIFETLVPSRSLPLVLANENPNQILHAEHLCIYVVDSPSHFTPPYTTVAAMLIPPGLESDWTFCTERGHLQVLRPYNTRCARLVLIGNLTTSTTPQNYNRIHFDFQERKIFEGSLVPLVRALCPGTLFSNPGPRVMFLHYYCRVKRRSVLDIRAGDYVGEMLIEDVEFDDGSTIRSLRFKRTPVWFQTQLTVVPLEATGGVDSLVPDTGVLVQDNLIPMVTSLSLIAPYLDEVIQYRRPRALCLGVGGGALISFLSASLAFEVVGVEVDETVLRVATEYFGLKNSEFVRLIVGDGIKFVEKLARQRAQQEPEDFDDYKEFMDGDLFEVEDFVDAMFDVITVDLDSRDAPIADTAPPSDFVNDFVFWDAKSILRERGILVINVRPPDVSFYRTLLTDLKEVFLELREINVSAVNKAAVNNFILIASASPLRDFFLTRLRSVISGAYLGRIRRL